MGSLEMAALICIFYMPGTHVQADPVYSLDYNALIGNYKVNDTTISSS